VKEGNVRTYDMMRLPGGPKALAAGAASTVEMTDAILAKLESAPELALAGAQREFV
jgi:isocitrate dehydrogenase (NAD+)